MAMALLTTVMATMLRFIMLLHLSIMHLPLFTMPRAAIGRRNRSGYQALHRDPGLTSIMTRTVMCGCWDIGKKDRVVRDTGRSSRSGLYNNAFQTLRCLCKILKYTQLSV